jgi:hypothetical protein
MNAPPELNQTEPGSDWKEKLRKRLAKQQELPEFREALKKPVPESIAGMAEVGFQTGPGVGAKMSSSRKLENQRKRRQRNCRVDYYASPEAMAIIDARTSPSVGGDRSSIINKLVLAAAKKASGIPAAYARARVRD